MFGRRNPQNVVRRRATFRSMLRRHVRFFCILQNPSQLCAILTEIEGATPVFVILKEISATSVRFSHVLCPLVHTVRNSLAQPSSGTVRNAQVPPNLRSFPEQLLKRCRVTSGNYSVTSGRSSHKSRTISEEFRRKSPTAFTYFRNTSAHFRVLPKNPGGAFRRIFAFSDYLSRNF